MTMTAQSQWKLKKLWVLGAIALGVLILLTVLAAPNAPQNSGSTFGRAPDGYGAWYAFMSERGTPVQRWQRPFSSLLEDPESEDPESGITLLRVNSQPTGRSLSPIEQEWLEQGNRLILLGVRAPVTDARFSTMQASPVGEVQIETTRRQRSRELNATQNETTPNATPQIDLGDSFGAIVWRQTLGEGEVIYAVTPHLAANAYQNQPGNFEFLAELLTEADQTLYVDEYMHGYREANESRGGNGTAAEGEESWVSYLARTPVFPVLIQLGLVLLVLVWAKNRRFGSAVPVVAPHVDNSKAYIQALAAVLQKARSREFIVEIVGREEQIQVQKALGLGSTPVDPDLLLATWVRQTGRPAAELEQVLLPYWQHQRLSESALLTWLRTIQIIRRNCQPL